MVKLKAPRGHSCAGFAGGEYEVRDGMVEVPDEAEDALRPHGYRRPAPEGARPVPPQKAR
jgi:hypothetical protein